MSEVAIAEIWRQTIGIEVIQLFNDVILTTKVEIIVAPNKFFVRGGILIKSVVNLGHDWGGSQREGIWIEIWNY
jgi:hypothetical protein